MHLIYMVFIMPLEYLFGAVCYKVYGVFHSESITIICLALFVSIVTSPLYAMAEEKRKVQLAQDGKIKHWERHIKKVFRGDERLAMLSTFYRERQYNVMAGTIRSLAPLILQIPFFVAAYNYIVTSSMLENADFLMLDDLNRPDALGRIFGLQMNVLPVVMTVINGCSAFIYLKGRTTQERIQAWGLALFFLVILYNCPAGLLLYWITNNIYSLFRNLIERFVIDKMRISLFLALLPLVVYSFWQISIYGKIQMFDGFFLMVVALPIYVLWRYRIFGRIYKFNREVKRAKTIGVKQCLYGVICGEVFMILLLGAVIPVNVIASSPGDFVHIYALYDPLKYVVGNLALYFGFFFWVTLFALSMIKMERMRYLLVMINSLAVFGVCQYLVFGNHYGLISEELIYDSLLMERHEKVISCLLFGLICVLCIAFRHFERGWFRLTQGAVLGTMVFVLLKWQGVREEVSRYEEIMRNPQNTASSEIIYHLSKTENNVIIIMLDRAIGAMLPYIMEEKPILKEQLDGFVYYPNTLSFGLRTNRGAAALFGGYEYTPEAINKNGNTSVKQKFAEALRVLPELFYENGFEVSVADLPFMNDEDFPGMDSYNRDRMHGYNLEGKYTPQASGSGNNTQFLQRRFFFYSLFRVLPLPLAEDVYSKGEYLQYKGELSEVRGRFLDAYMVLEMLPEITAVDEGGLPQFIMFDNNATHEPCYLQMPEYIPMDNVDNLDYEAQIKTNINGREMCLETKMQKQYFEVGVAALMKIGEYFDYLREKGAYDNTRIIIASDHGEGLGQFEDLIYMGGKLDVEGFNSLLLFKDYGTKGFSVSDNFMTNADVPLLALRNLIDSPVNPYTHNLMTDEYKKGRMLVSSSLAVGFPEGNVYDDAGGEWYTVQDGFLGEENWCLTNANK